VTYPVDERLARRQSSPERASRASAGGVRALPVPEVSSDSDVERGRRMTVRLNFPGVEHLLECTPRSAREEVCSSPMHVRTRLPC
jgi:hypothetical protein